MSYHKHCVTFGFITQLSVEVKLLKVISDHWLSLAMLQYYRFDIILRYYRCYNGTYYDYDGTYIILKPNL